MHTIRVAPAGSWWAVRSDAFDNDMMFRSGARAEAAAKRLAMALARAGHVAKLEVKARDGRTVARFLCPPTSEPEPVRADPAIAIA